MGKFKSRSVGVVGDGGKILRDRRALCEPVGVAARNHRPDAANRLRAICASEEGIGQAIRHEPLKPERPDESDTGRHSGVRFNGHGEGRRTALVCFNAETQGKIGKIRNDSAAQ